MTNRNSFLFGAALVVATTAVAADHYLHAVEPVAIATSGQSGSTVTDLAGNPCAAAANPCAAIGNPCSPCAVTSPCAAVSPCAISNPCAVSAPCAVASPCAVSSPCAAYNPCAVGG